MFNFVLIGALVANCAEAAFGRMETGHPAYPQTFNDQFNPLKFTGNVGPYSQRYGNGLSTETPEGCEVDQVVLFSRHGERYPTPPEVTVHRGLLSFLRLQKPKNGYRGSLTFLNDYQYFLEDDGYANLEIPSGPYSGLAGSERYGREAAARYSHLWDGQSVVPLFTDNYERDLETTRAFGQGFFGFNYTKSAAVNTYPSFDGGCLLGKWTECKIDVDLKALSNPLRFAQFDTAARRLSQENNVQFTATEVFGLMSLASYEISVKGDSPWVKVFSTDEWVAYQYACDAFFDCLFGHQSPRSKALGTLFINATATLFNQGPDKGLPLGIAFGHDVDLLGVIAALKLIEPPSPIDPYKITFNNNFRLTDVVPMGARLVAERLTCKGVPKVSYTGAVGSANSTNVELNTTTKSAQLGSRDASNSVYVRYVLNDAVVPWHICNDGPGFSCPLDEYNKVIKQVLQDNSYATVCHAPPPKLDFFWNYNTSTALNYNMGDIPYQAGQY